MAIQDITLALPAMEQEENVMLDVEVKSKTAFRSCLFLWRKTMDLNDLSTKEIEYLIEQYIHNQVHREILKRRLMDHVKFESLAEEFNYSTRHIKRIVYNSQDILYKRLESAEFSVDSFILQTER